MRRFPPWQPAGDMVKVKKSKDKPFIHLSAPPFNFVEPLISTWQTSV